MSTEFPVWPNVSLKKPAFRCALRQASHPKAQQTSHKVWNTFYIMLATHGIGMSSSLKASLNFTSKLSQKRRIPFVSSLHPTPPTMSKSSFGWTHGQIVRTSTTPTPHSITSNLSHFRTSHPHTTGQTTVPISSVYRAQSVFDPLLFTLAPWEDTDTASPSRSHVTPVRRTNS